MTVPTQRVYPARRDGWLKALLAGVTLVALLPGLLLLVAPGARAAGLLALAIDLVVLTSLGWIVQSTRYILTDEELVVRSGPLRWRVPLATLQAVVPTRTLFSAPAISLQHLQLQYGDRQTLLISPEEPSAFLDDLVQRVPSLVRQGDCVVRQAAATPR